jgi:nucleotide-binding universal stress UspA family protein
MAVGRLGRSVGTTTEEVAVEPDPDPILIAYDGSRAARRAIRVAGRLWPGRDAVVLNVCTRVPGLAATSEDARRDAALHVASAGAGLADDAGLFASPDIALTDREPAWAAIVDAADRLHAGVVVLGARGLTGFESRMLGSVSHGVAAHCSRPVLVVPRTPTRLARAAAASAAGAAS